MLDSLRTYYAKFQVLRRHSVLSDESTPEQLNTSLRAWRVTKRDQGYLRSLSCGACVDADGDPIPWYTYPAIEQLMKWDFSTSRILEYGCGNSSLWWANRALHVTSIESSRSWYEKVSSGAPSNCSVLLSPIEPTLARDEQVEHYVAAVDELGKFDVIVIDGVSNALIRLRCLKRSLPHLAENGLLILDNADWLPLSARLLREQGFFEADYSGLSPLNDYAGTTSLFFKSGFSPAYVETVCPGPAIGGHAWDWETVPKPWTD